MSDLDRVREALLKFRFSGIAIVVEAADDGLEALATHEKEDAERETGLLAANASLDEYAQRVSNELHDLLEAARGALEWFEANPLNETGQYHERHLRQVLQNIEKGK